MVAKPAYCESVIKWGLFGGCSHDWETVEIGDIYLSCGGYYKERRSSSTSTFDSNWELGEDRVCLKCDAGINRFKEGLAAQRYEQGIKNQERLNRRQLAEKIWEENNCGR